MDYRDMLNTAVFTLKPVDTIYKTLHTLYQCAGLHVVVSLLIYFLHMALFSVSHTHTHTHWWMQMHFDMKRVGAKNLIIIHQKQRLCLTYKRPHCSCADSNSVASVTYRLIRSSLKVLCFCVGVIAPKTAMHHSLLVNLLNIKHYVTFLVYRNEFLTLIVTLRLYHSMAWDAFLHDNQLTANFKLVWTVATIASVLFGPFSVKYQRRSSDSLRLYRARCCNSLKGWDFLEKSLEKIK